MHPRLAVDATLISIHPLSTALLQAAIDISADLRLRGSDAIFVALAHQLSIPLVSWDREQFQRASPLIETYTPDAYQF